MAWVEKGRVPNCSRRCASPCCWASTPVHSVADRAGAISVDIVGVSWKSCVACLDPGLLAQPLEHRGDEATERAVAHHEHGVAGLRALDDAAHKHVHVG